ncbi:MAG TPA: hypothetical protein RMH99_09730 [Sandaracinaceae bacterium LLY-WYZ-13_1]|nr:hypothetical protein [Sandaracinaceae bacterium LLY-WYZ-13_1]
MSPLRQSRLLLVAALALLGTAVGLLAGLLAPHGTIPAHDRGWGPTGTPRSAAVVGVPADRRGGECALRRTLDGVETPLRGCRAYQAPAVLLVGEGEARRTVVVWEHADRDLAVSTLDPGTLEVGGTRFVPRPRTSSGTLLPRTAVRAADARLAIWYRGGQVVSLGLDDAGRLTTWPGGASEVADAHFGPGAFVALFAAVALLAFYFALAGGALRLPGRLARAARAGRCRPVEMPGAGTTVVLDGQPLELDLSRARVIGPGLRPRARARRLAALAGRTVTLVLPALARGGDAYRRRDRLQVAELWPGDPAEALARSRALRAVAVAVGVAAAAALVLGLDVYLVS